MCIICVLPIGTEISEQELTNCWDNNPDGAGFMFVDEDNRIQIRKSMTFSKYMKAFEKEFSKYQDSTPFVLHFRIGTHGTKDIRNVHPFMVNRDVAMCHNGVIVSHLFERESPLSDTRQFVNTMLKSLPKNFLRNKGICAMISDVIGTSSNKLCFLNTNREVLIFNKSLGQENQNRWFSNGSFNYKKQKSNYDTGDVNSWYEGWYRRGGAYYRGIRQTTDNITDNNGVQARLTGMSKYCTTCRISVPSEEYDQDLEQCLLCVEAWSEMWDMAPADIHALLGV